MQMYSWGACTLAGISGIQISVLELRSKSLDFYKCGHKNLTNYRDQHCAAKSQYILRLFGNKHDYLHRGGCVNARANNLGIFYPIIPSERIKTRAMLDISGMRSSVTRIIPLGDQRDICACLNKRKNISVFQSRWKSRSFLCMNAPIV